MCVEVEQEDVFADFVEYALIFSIRERRDKTTYAEAALSNRLEISRQITTNLFLTI